MMQWVCFIETHGAILHTGIQPQPLHHEKMFYFTPNQILFCLHWKTGPQAVSRYFDAYHSSFNHDPPAPPPYLNSPAGQLHLYVNTHLGSDSPHMATNNLWKSLGFASKLCSSQFGQICFMPLSYYPGADEHTKHVSWQEQSVWSQISCGGNQANGTNTMDAKMFCSFFLWGKADKDQPSSVLRTLWPEVKTQQAALVTGHSRSPLTVDIQSDPL